MKPRVFIDMGGGCASYCYLVYYDVDRHVVGIRRTMEYSNECLEMEWSYKR